MFKPKTKSRLKQTLSGILALAVAASMASVIPVTAEETTLQTYSGDGYEVSYSIKGSWDGNQNIEVALTNTGSESLLNWALKYDAHGEIGGLWNGTVYDSDSTKYIVKNAGYNYEILPEQTVTFGYTLTGDDLEFPDAIELCSQRTVRTSDGYNVTMNVTNDWDTGFSGTITVENLGDSALEAWRLSFDTNFEITNLWNAQIIASEENYYTVANDVTTTPIGVGENKVFGFTATKESGTTPEISGFVMSEITVNSDFTTVDIPDDVEFAILAFGEYLEEDNALNIEWFTSVENGSFELMESYNNEDYITTAVLNDAYSYTYPLSDDFDTRYFKVVQTTEDGRTAESVPFVVTKSENGYGVDFLDSDSDGLEDIYEKIIGTDVNDPDTDGDGLTDYQEVYITGTDPNKYDSVTEGVSDADADPDGDGLSNAQEIELGTDPQNEDTDSDGLKDGEEINSYGTDPFLADTDGDGLEDIAEIEFKSDPLNFDSDSNGIPDGDEKRRQIFVYDVENSNCAISKVTVSSECTGYLKNSMTVQSIMNEDKLCSNLVGLVGEPFEIETTSEFDTATLTFFIDKSKSNNIPLDSIKFLWYNEENDEFVELPTQYDDSDYSISVETTHFSKYAAVDIDKWNKNWRSILADYKTLENADLSKTKTGVNIVFDRAFTDSCADPVTYENDFAYCKRLNIVKDLLSSFDYRCSVLTELGYGAYYSIFPHGRSYDLLDIKEYSEVFFHTTATKYYDYRYPINCYTFDNTYTSLDLYSIFYVLSIGERGVKYKYSDCDTINIYILANDYTDFYSEDTCYKYQKFLDEMTGKIYILDMRPENDSKLQTIAENSGGEYLKYTVADMEHLKGILNSSEYTSALTDTDKDGFPDIEEEKIGIVSSNGIRHFTDADSADSDNDGLKESEEASAYFTTESSFSKIKKKYHTMTSYPDDEDSDRDGLLDREDPYKLQKNQYDRYDRESAVSYALEWYNGRNPEYREYPYDCANFVSQCLFNGYLSMNENWHCYYNGVKDYWDFVFSIDELKYIINNDNKYLENWDITDEWNSAKEQYMFFSDNRYCIEKYVVSSDEDVEYLIANNLVMVGDLAYVSDDKWNHSPMGRDPYHAAIISQISENDISYAAHTDNHRYRSVKDVIREGHDANLKLYIVTLKDVIIYE